jgi:hypothetical protein
MAGPKKGTDGDPSPAERVSGYDGEGRYAGMEEQNIGQRKEKPGMKTFFESLCPRLNFTANQLRLHKPVVLS